MKKIALISDNHSYAGEDTLKHLRGCDEIWHAGDIGSLESIKEIRDICTFRAVYGNIDGHAVRAEFPLNLSWECEGMNMFMTHIGGYTPKYYKRVRKILEETKPDLYICGHSHILKVMPDRDLDLLHMNPGAYGHHGFHKMRTILKFEIENGAIENARVIELGMRGKLSRRKSSKIDDGQPEDLFIRDPRAKRKSNKKPPTK